MNELPMFETTVHVDKFEDIDMHFLHVKSDVKGAIPLVGGAKALIPHSTP
jgi:hypothetical protein